MSDFTESVERNTRDIQHLSAGISWKCEDCQAQFDLSEDEIKALFETGDLCDEGSFSWYPCDCCGSNLGGNRYSAHGFLNGHLIHLDICEDCMNYLANGDEPEEDF